MLRRKLSSARRLVFVKNGVELRTLSLCAKIAPQGEYIYLLGTRARRGFFFCLKNDGGAYACIGAIAMIILVLPLGAYAISPLVRG